MSLLETVEGDRHAEGLRRPVRGRPHNFKKTEGKNDGETPVGTQEV